MRIEEYKRYLDMMNQWLILEQEGKKIDRFLKSHEWRSVAVYGMSIYGRHIVRELKNTDCEVKYAIDRKRMEDYEGVRVWKPIESLDKVDVVINSVIHEHNKIVEEIRNVLLCPVISLEDIVFGSY